MAGNYQNKNEQYIQPLQSWVSKIIAGKLWEKFEDLHIDEVHDDFKLKDNWMDASLLVYEYLIDIIDGENYDLLLAIQLTYSQSITDLNNVDSDYIKKSLDITPPSFYLFPKYYKNLEMTIKSATYLNSMSNKLGWNVYFKEEYNEEEYFRVLYIKN